MSGFSFTLFCFLQNLCVDQMEASTSLPRAFELLQIVSFKFSSLEAKIVFKCPTQLPDLTSNFSVKGKISDHDCLLIYQALKLRTCITFLPCHSLAKANSLP